jgi:hypothetical protein
MEALVPPGMEPGIPNLVMFFVVNDGRRRRERCGVCITELVTRPVADAQKIP